MSIRIFEPRIATEEEIILLGFSPKILACPCCGVCRVDLNLLQRLRAVFDIYGLTFNKFNSVCRCWNHHVSIYKKKYPNDWEKKITRYSLHLITDYQMKFLVCQAADIPFLENPRLDLWEGGYKYYEGSKFAHLDIGKQRRW